MSEPSTAAEHEPEPPRTGVPRIDAALAGLPALGEAPLAEHHDQLAGAHDVLAAALSDQGPPEPEPEPDDRDDPARS